MEPVSERTKEIITIVSKICNGHTCDRTESILDNIVNSLHKNNRVLIIGNVPWFLFSCVAYLIEEQGTILYVTNPFKKKQIRHIIHEVNHNILKQLKMRSNFKEVSKSPEAFDVIILSGVVTTVPSILMTILKHGGRVVIPVKDDQTPLHLQLIDKSGDGRVTVQKKVFGNCGLSVEKADEALISCQLKERYSTKVKMTNSEIRNEVIAFVKTQNISKRIEDLVLSVDGFDARVPVYLKSALLLNYIEKHIQKDSRILFIGNVSWYLLLCTALLMEERGKIIVVQKNESKVKCYDLLISKAKKTCLEIIDFIVPEDKINYLNDESFDVIIVSGRLLEYPHMLHHKLKPGGRGVFMLTALEAHIVDNSKDNHITTQKVMVDLLHPSQNIDCLLPDNMWECEGKHAELDGNEVDSKSGDCVVEYLTEHNISSKNQEMVLEIRKIVELPPVYKKYVHILDFIESYLVEDCKVLCVGNASWFLVVCLSILMKNTGKIACRYAERRDRNRQMYVIQTHFPHIGTQIESSLKKQKNDNDRGPFNVIIWCDPRSDFQRFLIKDLSDGGRAIFFLHNLQLRVVDTQGKEIFAKTYEMPEYRFQNRKVECPHMSQDGHVGVDEKSNEESTVQSCGTKPNTSKVANDVNIDNIPKQTLECPVCNDVLKPPTVLCSNGHVICESCQEGDTCRVCGRHLSVISNHTFDKFLSKSVVHPCRWTDIGCNEVLSLKDVTEHEESCPFNEDNDF